MGVGCSLAEVLIGVTGLEFAYSQSPPSIRGTVTALWAIVSALGNVIVTATASLPVARTVPLPSHPEWLLPRSTLVRKTHACWRCN